jgi:hypothetical protein
VGLYTSDLDTVSSMCGLRKWPMHVDNHAADSPGGTGAGGSKRLSPGADEPPRVGSAQRLQLLDATAGAEERDAVSHAGMVTGESRPPRA